MRRALDLKLETSGNLLIFGHTHESISIHFNLPLCDANIGTRDRSFLLEIRCLSHLLGLNGKVFLIGTDGIQKFENLAYSHNFFRFLIVL